MNWLMSTRLRAVLAGVLVAFLANSSQAGVPDEQLLPKGTLDSVVRVLTPGGNGSGSVIDKKVQYDGQGNVIGYWLCVLTANHVVKNEEGIEIAFNNFGNPNEGPYDAWIVAEGRNKQFGSPSNPEFPDLAILGVKIVGQNPFIDNLVPLTVIDDTNVQVGSRFSVVGYGNTGVLTDINGDHVPDGYLEIRGTYGNRRWGNNIFDYKIKDTWGQWSHQAWEYDLSGPIPPIIGEGFPLRGDSGGPLLVQYPVDVPIYGQFPPVTRPAFTDGLVGVVSRGAAGFVRWGDREYDVRITPEYKAWIDYECMNVPEPASLAALALGSLALLARRRRRKA